MTEVKLTKKYTLLTPGYLKEQELISKIQKLAGKNVKHRLGLRDSYSICILDMCGNYDTSLDIDIVHNKNGTYTTKIIQTIEGVRKYDKEMYESEPDIIKSLSVEFNGLILLECFETVDYCKSTGTYYVITYNNPNSLEYKLLDFCINKTGDAREAMALYQLIKDNNGELLDILKTI